MEDVRFAALLCSRLCHDLVSPVGAMANGIEILADETNADMRQQVVELLEQSARQTSNRLQFFRLAFGAAGGLDEQLDLREAHKALASLFAGSNVELDWQPVAETHAKGAIKLLLNLALIAGEGLIRGGRLSIALEADGAALSMIVTAEGARFVLQDKVRAALLKEIDGSEVDPRAAPAYLVALLAGQLHGQVEIAHCSDTGITLKALLGGR